MFFHFSRLISSDLPRLVPTRTIRVRYRRKTLSPTTRSQHTTPVSTTGRLFILFLPALDENPEAAVSGVPEIGDRIPGSPSLPDRITRNPACIFMTLTDIKGIHLILVNIHIKVNSIKVLING